MFMKNIYILFFLFSLVIVNAQTQILTPLESVNNYKNTEHNINTLKKAIRLSNGDSFIVGTKMETFSTMDVFVAKLNNDMDTLWTYVISTPDKTSIDDYRNADVDANGNLYVHSVNLIDYNSYSTTTKHYITKLSSAGNLIFQTNLNDVALSHNDYGNYTTVNTPYTFGHVDASDNFVLVYNSYSPINKVTFFKFLPNNTTAIVHRTDILPYNALVDLYGYFTRFYYLNGNYYFLSGVRKTSSFLSHEYRVNKVLPQGYSSVDLTQHLVGNQAFLSMTKTELKANNSGTVMYFTFDSDITSDSYFTVALSNNLTYLGGYHDTSTLNNFHSSQILSNGDIRLFGKSSTNLTTTSSLSEVILNTTGNVIKNTLDPNFNGNQILATDDTFVGVVKNNSIEIFDNNWTPVLNFSNVSLNNVNLIKRENSVFYAYGEESKQIINNASNVLDDVSAVAYKLEDRVVTYKNYNYQGMGNASCNLHFKNTFLSDNSSIIFYSCAEGLALNSASSKANYYIKKLDVNYNTLFDIKLDYTIGNLITVDDNDNFYYVTFKKPQPNTTVYYLSKRDKDGNLIYEVPQDNFDEIFVHNNQLFLISYDNVNPFNSYEIDPNTGIAIQQLNFIKSRPLAVFNDNNDHYRYYISEEYIPNTYNSECILKIYKNFQLFKIVSLGTNFATTQHHVLDSTTKSIYFTLYNKNSYNSFLFKVNIDGSFTHKNVNSNTTNPLFVINNNLYVNENNELKQLDKISLQENRAVPFNSSNRFYRYKTFILVTEALDNKIKVIDENFIELANLEIEREFNFLTIDQLNRLHFNNTITNRYLLNTLPQWTISNTTLYDFNTITLDLDQFIAKNDEKNIKIYPNPTTNNISIELLGDDGVKEVLFFDISGKLVKLEYINNIDVSTLSAGTYLLKIKTQSNKIYHSKMVKK